MASRSRIKSFDFFIRQEGTSQRVHLQILEGDITTENIDAVAVFKLQLPESSDGVAKGDSLRILTAAGDGIHDEYATAKDEGGRHAAKGVVLTKAGALSSARYIMHVVVNSNPVRFRETLDVALRLAEKRHFKSISFPTLPYELQSLTSKLFESIDDFIKRDRPICLHFLQLVVSERSRFNQFANTRQIIEFEKYKDILVEINPRMPRSGEGGSGACQVDNHLVKLTATEVCALRIFSFPDEIHVGLNAVCLHVKSSVDFYTTPNSSKAYVGFRKCCLSTCVDASSPEIQAFEDIVHSTIGNRTWFEITIDESPGKFIRLKSAIQKVLQIADERGIKHVVFPLGFDYGDQQIDLELKRGEVYNISTLVPLLYFQAISDYVLYFRSSSLHSLHIYILPEHNNEYDKITRSGLITRRKYNYTYNSREYYYYRRVKNRSPFRSMFKSIQVDPIFQAGNLSVVHEKVHLKRRKWEWREYRNEYNLRERGTIFYTTRYTYGCTVRRISCVEVPMELLLERSKAQSAATYLNLTSKEAEIGDPRDRDGFVDFIRMEDFIVNGRTRDYVLFKEGDVGPCPSGEPTKEQKIKQQEDEFQEWMDLPTGYRVWMKQNKLTLNA